MTKLYDTDFVRWTETQRDLLIEKRFDRLDLENLIEEIDSLGRSNHTSLKSHLRTVLIHLLKLTYTLGSRDPARKWMVSIQEARSQIEDLVEESPSLRPMLLTYLDQQYTRARRQAHEQLSIYDDDHGPFPETCPWSVEQVLDPKFLPEVERDADI